MPSLGGSRRRNAKQQAASKKLIPPPPISVTSSTSIETPRASLTPRYEVCSSSLRPSKRPGMANARMERPSSGYKESKAMGLLEKENVDVDVFSFLQNGEDEDSESLDGDNSSKSSDLSPSQPSPPRLTDISQRSPRYSDLEVRAIQDGVQRAWGRASLHSDSGISVRSHSPDQESPVMGDKLPLDHRTPMIEESLLENDDSETNGLLISPHLEPHGSPFSHRYSPSGETSHSSGPEAYQVSLPQLMAHRPVSHDDTMPEMHNLASSSLVHLKSRRGSMAARPAKSGYELLASNISSHEEAFLKPIYRKFEILNNRMLLYLQDEIAQMEEDLKELDAAIAMEDVDLGKRGPASRRSEAKLPSQLQWHRLDLLGRCFAKVEQYNRALTSYAKLSKSLDSASHADVTAYSQWISDHTPIAEQESAFLEKSADLISIPSPSSTAQKRSKHSISHKTGRSDSTVSSSEQSKISLRHRAAENEDDHDPMASLSRKELEMPLITIFIALISTIIVFKVIPRLFARLGVSMLVGVATLGILAPRALTSLDELRHWGRGIVGYTMVMIVLAMVVG